MMIFRSRAVSELLSETAKTDQEIASIRHANKVSPCPEPPIGSIWCLSSTNDIFGWNGSSTGSSTSHLQ